MRRLARSTPERAGGQGPVGPRTHLSVALVRDALDSDLLAAHCVRGGRERVGQPGRGRRRGRIDRERLTARHDDARSEPWGCGDRVRGRTGGGLDRRPIGAEGLGLGALGGVGHGATGVVRSFCLREHGGGSSTCAARETNCRVVQSGGQLTPRGPAGAGARRGRGTTGRATRRLHARARTRARVGSSPEASGMPPMCRFVGRGVLFLSHAPRECVRLPKQHQMP